MKFELRRPISSFESQALAHLDAAYNLARWLVRDDQVAQDMVQEAYLRALNYYDTFHGDDIRPWLLRILRNTCYTWLARNNARKDDVEFDEQRDSEYLESSFTRPETDPETLLARKEQRTQLQQAIDGLPAVYREALILREMEELSYEDIALVAEIPLGTVMSRLARARVLLRKALLQKGEKP
ncbi:MAG TPA: sigma-70 family RNA polymerase sigma factor [Rhodocyclaceae bacterium]